MKKTLAALLLFLLFAVTAFAGASYWFGWQAEQQYRKLFQTLQNQAGNLRLEARLDDYRRGLFSAVARITYQISLPVPGDSTAKGTTLRILQQDHISHGPWPLTAERPEAWPPGLAMALVRSSFLPAPDGEQASQALSSLLGAADLKAYSEFHLDGSGVAWVRMSAFQTSSDSGLAVRWGGLDNDITFTLGEPATSTGNLLAPELSVVSDRGRLALTNLRVNWRLQTESLMLGTLDLGCDELQILSKQDGEPFAFGLRQAQIEQNFTLENQLVKAQLLMKYQAVQSNQTHLGPGIFDIEARRLDSGALLEIQKQVQALRRSGISAEQLQQQSLGAYLQQLPVLLRQSPEVEIRQLQVELPDGRLHGRLLLRFDGEQGAIDPASLLKATALDAELSADKQLVRASLQRRAEKEIAGQNPDLEQPRIRELAQQEATQRLAYLVAQGYVTEEGEQLQAKVKLESGNALLNGNPVDPSHFFGGPP